MDIPLIILDLEDSPDEYEILSLFRQLFENEGYNAYVIGMEPECVLYGFEYMPDIKIPLTDQLVKDFMEGQTYYSQSDLILWSVTKEQKKKICSMYPDFDIEIIWNKADIFAYAERNLIFKQKNDEITDKHIMTLYRMIVNCLAEDEYE